MQKLVKVRLISTLSQQMEAFFMEIAKDPGYEDFEKQAWGFKVHMSYTTN
jgi:hypothetical protein